MQRLTDLAYWDENWWNRKRPQRLTWFYRDMDYETVRLLAGKAKHDRVRALEVGAGGSRILPYLARKFGFEIFGSDFSLAGCRLARANAALQGVPLRTVCEDLFQSSLAPESFDLVYSAGLVEHFDDTRAAVKEHFRLTKPGGRLVIIVPNFQGARGASGNGLRIPFGKFTGYLDRRNWPRVSEPSDFRRFGPGILDPSSFTSGWGASGPASSAGRSGFSSRSMPRSG